MAKKRGAKPTAATKAVASDSSALDLVAELRKVLAQGGNITPEIQQLAEKVEEKLKS